MAATAKAVLIQLDQIRWKDFIFVTGGAGQVPTVAPYLWTIFFTIDGSSVRLAETFYLNGVRSYTRHTALTVIWASGR